MSLSEQFRLDDQVALVTGAASGLGAQFAEAMAEAGAHVVLADTNEEGLERTAEAVRGLDREALVFPGFFRSNLGGYDNPEVLQAMIDFTPMGRVADTAEIKGPALFLASAASDFMTGQTLVVDGGCLAK